MALLTKKWVFSFMLSFAATFATGFLFWLIFVWHYNFSGVSVFTPSYNGVEEIVLEPTIQPTQEPEQPAADPEIILSPQNLKPTVLTAEQVQDLLDDIKEKLDIIQQKVNQLVAQNLAERAAEQALAQEQNIQTQEEQCRAINWISFACSVLMASQNQEDDQILNNKFAEKTVGAGAQKQSYPEILISEVQIKSSQDEKEEFVELYNLNNFEIDLSGWYLQRKTATGSNFTTYAPSNLFFGKKIAANGYFLIARAGYFENLADILTENPITDNNSFALKNPNGEISSQISLPDEVVNDASWCFDLAVCQSTPKAQNIEAASSAITYPELLGITITKPALKLSYLVGEELYIRGLEITGTYTDGSTKIEGVTPENIFGFDSSSPTDSQNLTINIKGVATNYEISIVAVPAAQLKITTLPQIIMPGVASSIFTVEAQDSFGLATKFLDTTTVGLSSDSPTGLFALASATTGLCGDDWTKTSLTIGKNTAHKSFCYKDETSGIYTISVFAGTLIPDFQQVEIIAIKSLNY